MRQAPQIILILICGSILSCVIAFVVRNAGKRAEHLHGIKFPKSAAHIQSHGNAWMRFCPIEEQSRYLK
jgi:hypothetical protein